MARHSQSGAERRLQHDRRSGSDRRNQPRAERRSTVERRRWLGKKAEEPASEHIRNALQLLLPLTQSESLDSDSQRDLAAAVDRLLVALREVERGR
jgi:hypothetical protein